MQRLRIGLVGCGGIARWHASTLLSLADAEIVGLADPSEANLEAMRKENPALAQVPSFSTAEKLYEAVKPEAVEIATPHTMHYNQVVAAIGHGLHVLCEKPLACSPAEARDIAQRAESAGVTVMVSYQRRFDPAYLYMRRVIADGQLGEIRTITITCGQNWRKGTTGSWRQDPALSGGGMLMDSGSHMVDMLLWLVDQKPVAVSAIVDNLGAPVELNSSTTVRFANGAQGQLTVVGDFPTTWLENVLIVGGQGVLRLETEPQHPWRTGRVLHYRDGELVQPLKLPAGQVPDEAWLEAIRGSGPNPAPPEAGLRVAELTTAIYKSGRESHVVTIE